MRPQFSGRRPTEVTAVWDLFLGTEFVVERCELRDQSLGIVEVGNGDKHVENGLGTQGGDSGAPHMVHGEDRWPECRSELRRRRLEEEGPARVVGNDNDLGTLQSESWHSLIYARAIHLPLMRKADTKGQAPRAGFGTFHQAAKYAPPFTSSSRSCPWNSRRTRSAPTGASPQSVRVPRSDSSAIRDQPGPFPELPSIQRPSTRAQS